MTFRKVIVAILVLSFVPFAIWRINVFIIDRSVKALVTQHIAEDYRIVEQIKRPNFMQDWSWIGKVELLSEGKYVLDENQKRHDYTEEYKYITEILLRNKIISSEKEVFEGQLYIGLVDLKGSYCCEYLAISKGNFAFIFLHE